MNKLAIGFAVAGLMLAGSVSAGEVLATLADDAKSAKGGTPIALDIVASGGEAGFSFKVEVPGILESSNLKSCLAELPKGFTGGCSVAKGGVFVIASSDSPSVTLPSGLVSVGTIYVEQGPIEKGADSSIRITQVEFSDNSGNSTAGTAKVANN